MDATLISPIIITRPKGRANGLMEQLESFNQQRLASAPPIKFYHCPLIQIEGYFEQAALTHFNFDGIIFISGNAVLWAKSYFVDQHKGSNDEPLNEKNNWQTLLKSPIFAIGTQTAAALEQQLTEAEINNKVIFPQQMNSEGFLEMPELSQISGQSWLIVKGIGGRQRLKKGLEQRGARVSELVVYQRKLPDLIAQKQIESYNQLNPLWVVTSVQAIVHLERILRQQTKPCRVIVSSDRIAKEATRLKFKICGQAKDASDDQLSHCIQQVVNTAH